ncbi:MAG TPA: T9SS type A sorting domain-containing protein [Bacteroidetes bacterium]|nr:T9SS type A sorting domain-containing protein [Bacteroidota bacterium]
MRTEAVCLVGGGKGWYCVRFAGPPPFLNPASMLHRYAAAVLALVLAASPLAAQSLAEHTATRYLQSNWNRHGLQQADVADLVVTDEVPGPNGSRIVYLRQAIGGIEIASGPMAVAIDRDGRVVHAAGRLTPGLSRLAVSGGAAISAEAAAAALAQSAGVATRESFRAVSQKASAERETVLSDAGVTRIPSRARLVYAVDGGTLRLAWETTLFLKNGGDWFGQIDAATGRVLHKEDRLVRDAFGPAHASHTSHAPTAAPASTVLAPFASRMAQELRGGTAYRVYAMPLESPIHSATLPPADGRTVVVDPHDLTASPFGWHDTDGVAGPEFTITRGNNVHAYLDRDDDEAPDANGEAEGGASLQFDFAVDFAQDPSISKDASVTNLFYWSNLVHDVMYGYGFDEASGNFQANNYGNGGADGDAVDSESQSGADICNEFFPCENNANFSTPADGSEPRMQMYVGTSATPELDGSFDNMVVVHEYGHGISIRMTGGPSNVGCLSTSTYPEQMGEGWSDFFGAMMTMKPGDARADARPVGNYLFGQAVDGPGIRPAPYSTDFGVNAYTYGDTNSSALSAPHGVGFVWATALWEATWDMIDEFGYSEDIWDASGTAGNQKMMNLVINALKLQPCGPGFVDGRDAILAADELIYGGAHQDLLWAAFARRGLGFGASQGASTSRSDQTESFIVPEADPPAPITDLSAVPNGDYITLEFTATGDDGTAGQASEYLVRYSDAPILTEADWDAATPAAVSALPQVSGTAESVKVFGFDFSTAYHLAIKAVDDAFNVSEVSNSVSVTTLGPPALNVAADPIQFTAEVGETDTQMLTIGNTGEGDLSYSISLAETADTAALRAARYAAGTAARKAAAPSPVILPEIKDAPTVRGATTPAKDQGGPDAFGYKWVDSDEPGGPVFDWVDISSTGTAVVLSDDDVSDEIALPFPFPFYGEDQTSFRLSSNGWLGFNYADGSSQIGNDPMPDTSAPNGGVIAMYWDDLDPDNASGGSSQILYQDMGDGRFVITYEAVPHYPDNTGEVNTFQAILYRSGAIVLQYLTTTDDESDPLSHTVGMENLDGTDGLQVVHNAAYLHDNLAIRISAFWGEVTAGASGFIPAGTTSTVAVTADATGLLPGTYSGVLTVSSNDPDAAEATVPLQLTVTDANAPAAALSATSVTGDAPRGDVATQVVTLSNTGGSDLDWTLSDASGTMPDWLSLDVAGGALAAGASVEITLSMEPGVTYAPATTQTTTLTLASNDPAGSIEMDVAMNVLPGVAAEDDLDFDGPYTFGALAPNPARGSATATFAVRDPQTVTVELLDVLGRRVALVQEGAVPAMARQTVALDASDLASGAYVLVLRGETFTASQRITIAR